jgi:cytochrome c oxidase subunit 3/cytochrome o ubiquinol oxidase subunit 3
LSTEAPAHDAQEHYTSTGLTNNKLAIWAFLGSECLFFGSFISTFLLYHDKLNGGPSPKEIYNIPFIAVVSFVLVLSSMTAALGLLALQRGEVKAFRAWIAATALLGLIFVGGQSFEFTHLVHEGFTIRTSPFSSAFLVLTGFHGAHVTVGILMLLGLLAMSFTGRLGPEDAPRAELVILYWGFVDIVWVIIFTVVYLIPTLGSGG